MYNIRSIKQGDITMLKQQFFNIHDGLGQENRVVIANGLAHLLADSYSLYLKTHNS